MGAAWERIPDTWFALAIAGALAWAYFRWQPLSEHRAVLQDLAFSVPVTYIFTQRLAEAVLHLSPNWHEDLLNVLSSPGHRGWIPAAIMTAVATWWILGRKGSWNRETLSTFMLGFFAGSIGFFVYYAWKDVPPYQTQDVVRLLTMVLLFVALHRTSPRQRDAHRLWGIFGAVLLVTSIMVPRLSITFGLSPAQWVFFVVLVLAIAIEAVSDGAQITR